MLKRKYPSAQFYVGKGARRPYKKARTGGGSMAVVGRKGYTTVPRTRGIYAQGEMKYFDTELQPVAIVSNGDWTATEYDPNVFPVASQNNLFTPTVGAGIDQRIGKQVFLHKLKIKALILTQKQLNQTAPDDTSTVRFIVVQDMQTNGTQLQGEQVFRAGSATDTNMNACAFQNIDSFGRFKVLKDIIVPVQNPNMAYDGTNLEQQGLVTPLKMTINFKKPVSVRFNAVNGGTIADIVDNSFHILVYNSSTNLAPFVTYMVRCCYKESG